MRLSACRYLTDRATRVAHERPRTPDLAHTPIAPETAALIEVADHISDVITEVISATAEPGAMSGRASWVQCGCTALVAVGAAYASYRHGREFAERFGADTTTAVIWPLIVDGLVLMATVELSKTTGHGARQAGGRWAAWLAFGLGICLSISPPLES